MPDIPNAVIESIIQRQEARQRLIEQLLELEDIDPTTEVDGQLAYSKLEAAIIAVIDEIDDTILKGEE